MNGYENLRMAVVNILGDWCTGESDQFLADRLNEKFCLFPIRLTSLGADPAISGQDEDQEPDAGLLKPVR